MVSSQLQVAFVFILYEWWIGTVVNSQSTAVVPINIEESCDLDNGFAFVITITYVVVSFCGLIGVSLYSFKTMTGE